MSLLEAFISVMQLWRPGFISIQSFQNARDYACAIIGSFGLKKTLTNISISTGNLDKKPSAIYKFFSKRKWSPDSLFNPIFKQCLPYFKKGYIALGWMIPSSKKRVNASLTQAGIEIPCLHPSVLTSCGVCGFYNFQLSVVLDNNNNNHS